MVDTGFSALAGLAQTDQHQPHGARAKHARSLAATLAGRLERNGRTARGPDRGRLAQQGPAPRASGAPDRHSRWRRRSRSRSSAGHGRREGPRAGVPRAACASGSGPLRATRARAGIGSASPAGTPVPQTVIDRAAANAGGRQRVRRPHVRRAISASCSRITAAGASGPSSRSWRTDAANTSSTGTDWSTNSRADAPTRSGSAPCRSRSPTVRMRCLRSTSAAHERAPTTTTRIARVRARAVTIAIRWGEVSGTTRHADASGAVWWATHRCSTRPAQIPRVVRRCPLHGRHALRGRAAP